MFNKRLYHAMKKKGYNKHELSQRTLIGECAIGYYLEGLQVPKLKNVKRLAQILEVDYLWLLGGEMVEESKVHTVEKEKSQYVKNFDLVKIMLGRKALINFCSGSVLVTSGDERDFYVDRLKELKRKTKKGKK